MQPVGRMDWGRRGVGIRERSQKKRDHGTHTLTYICVDVYTYLNIVKRSWSWWKGVGVRA